MRQVNIEGMNDEKLVQFILNISHLGHNMSKVRIRIETFEEVFVDKARELINNHINKLP